MGLHGLDFPSKLPMQLSLAVAVSVLVVAAAGHAHSRPSGKYNAIDQCWRWNKNWATDRQRLATCSVGFAGKMRGNIGEGLTRYKVTDPSDDAINPKPGTLRYGATVIQGKVWITFKRGIPMHIRLQKPLYVSSFTAIDGRGASVHIAHGGCLVLDQVNNVIIHGLRIHHCQNQVGGAVMVPGSNVIVTEGPTDGDAIRVLESRKVWIDHNTLFECQDGLIDVTLGSTQVTISNNWFRNHDKVMLLGHDDGFVRDRNMRVTVVYNHFGPLCNQRMPRVRHGFAHVVNNLYQGWQKYAIGGSMGTSIKSQANLFVAGSTNKQVTWGQEGSSWNFRSVDDVFENGAHFITGGDHTSVKPHYTPKQKFKVANAMSVRELTRSSGALRCPKRSRC